jgi:tetratricopeptide (TPR) repeat protein
VLQSSAQYSEAAEVLRKGLELQPYKPEPLLRATLGSVYRRAGEYDTGMRLVAETYEDSKGGETEGQYIRWLARESFGAHRYDDAIASFEIAMRDGHELPASRSLLADSYLAIGDIQSATLEVQRAEELVAQQMADGRAMSRSLSFARLSRMTLDIAVNDVREMLPRSKELLARAESNSDDPWVWLDLYEGGLQSIILGRYDEGAHAMEKLLRIGEDPENYALAAYAFSKLGDEDMTQELLDKGRENVDQHFQRRGETKRALVYASLFLAIDNQADLAIGNLQRAFDKGYRDHGYLAYMPPFDPIRNDPRFTEILRLMRADTQKMRERVDSVRDSGDWESLIARFSPQQTASR